MLGSSQSYSNLLGSSQSSWWGATVMATCWGRARAPGGMLELWYSSRIDSELLMVRGMANLRVESELLVACHSYGNLLGSIQSYGHLLRLTQRS
ncbi:uncharacterized protein LAJ45_02996 [Morchella importuna]|uniref:uncharacterized protein n=1 Tax=Morchella importuna TaxID=1174673 RepID=UPI001E8E7CCC|nr:uncharacterized protein LAJ45_02996 [Morchella importuna]KAH8152771.1 hypothetical protein LAJ45_02996 [Morchella importuna]